jgi:hypothetical protein
MTGLAALRFWLIWTVVSGASAGIMFIVAAIPAGLVSAVLVLGFFGALGMPLLLPCASAVVGWAIGATAGTFQSWLLPWEGERKHLWFRRSMLGWAVGSGIGCLIAVALELIRLAPTRRGRCSGRARGCRRS